MGIVFYFSETAKQPACVILCSHTVRVCDSVLNATVQSRAYCSNVSVY